ncbi:sigma-70 family RNA polymerase sigma factor [Notoacmeibacter sp. MSK16QG-6]|uniref:sigma-70 family RNA polymerase sigma factor n=1 Tax=Notoacmeibacter sp. MSK16QG-6 TaxID=2957982 RepID=UPI00209FAC81|nr:sigma-70 family RNA polymerase sigma factor [Notoacmeibacter sp. MSK16QG-6]MCP1198720.1 sigma-70 family RNA polymerase sigma factor [Notoacmeibacter sp. MSK16QG-6]
MTSEEVAKLIVRVSLRDRQAFDRLYAATSPKLFAICIRILKDRAEAEEALQEVFVRVWTRADRFAISSQHAVGWLCTVARNHAIDRIRSRRAPTKDIDEAFDMASDDPDPERLAVLSSEGDRIDECMDELETDRAQAVRSAYVDGASYAELADRFDVPLNTMRTWLRRSLLKLRHCLEA